MNALASRTPKRGTEPSEPIGLAPDKLPPAHQVQLVMGSGRGTLRAGEFAARLGVCGRTVRRMYERGELPGALEHGPKILVIPTALLRLAQAYGLRRVALMARAGLIPTPAHLGGPHS